MHIEFHCRFPHTNDLKIRPNNGRTRVELASLYYDTDQESLAVKTLVLLRVSQKARNFFFDKNNDCQLLNKEL